MDYHIMYPRHMVEECVHLISPDTSFDDEFYLEVEEREQNSSNEEEYGKFVEKKRHCLQEEQYTIDTASLTTCDEMSYLTCTEPSLSFDSKDEEREPSQLSELEKAQLFTLASIPNIPSPYPYLRVSPTGKVRYSTSSLHPLQQHERACHANKKEESVKKQQMPKKLPQTQTKKNRLLTPIPETWNTESSLIQRSGKFSSILATTLDTASNYVVHLDNKNKKEEVSKKRCLEMKQRPLQGNTFSTETVVEKEKIMDVNRTKKIYSSVMMETKMNQKQKHKNKGLADFKAFFRTLQRIHQ